MKKTLLSLIILISIGMMTKAGAQASCPIITNFQIVPHGGGVWHVQFNYQNPTSGNKWVSVEALCNSTQMLAPTGLNCFKVPTDGSSPLYTSATFSCSSIANLTVNVRSHTGNECGGTVCQIQRSISGSPLPVVFKSFNATRNQSTVSLTWTTGTEVNNTGFEVQRRIGAADWQDIAFVPTKATAGNSSYDVNYAYTDLNGTSGLSQYRLKQVDLDGKSDYSTVKAVYGLDQKVRLTVYPNPTSNGKVKVVFDDGGSSRDISLMDMSGRIIKQMKAVTSNTIEITDLVAGMYSLRVINTETGEQSVEKILVNR